MLRALESLRGRLRWAAAVFIPVAAVATVAAVLWIDTALGPDRDAVERLLAHRPATPSVVLDRDGRWVGRFYVERRRPVALEDVPLHLRLAFLAAEDASFYEHGGLDLAALVRAAWKNVSGWGIEQGGSTITQQLAKNVLLHRERSFSRKLREMALALRIERQLDKDEILERYLNEIYLGAGAFGVGEAAWRYFGKPVEALDLSESALLAGLPQRPSKHSPLVDPAAAERRRQYVLGQMLELEFAPPEAIEAALASPPALHPSAEPEGARVAGHFLEEVRRALSERLGSQVLLEGGLSIETTLRLGLQQAAWEAVRTGLVEHPAPGEPRPEGALVALDAQTGDVLALVGGYDAAASPFDRATQARRQPGSAFKPFVYAAAVAAGWSQASMLPDYPQQYWDPVAGAFWTPRNYNDRFRGLVTLREAFVRSLNNPTIELMRKVGTQRVLKVARAAGIQSPLDKNLGIALGTSEVSLLELTRAYGPFANGGHRIAPRFVRRVLDREGRVLAEDLYLLPADPDAAEPGGAEPAPPALDPRVAFVVADLMRGAVDEPDGTGHGAISLGRGIAGKTGTSDDYRDAWFVGFSPEIVAGVWMGHDQPRPLGRKATGGRAALPIWIRFMQDAQAGQKPHWPWPPRGVAYHRFDVDTGEAPDASTRRSFEGAFLAGTAPASASQARREELSAARAALLAEFVPPDESVPPPESATP
jgi:penicillin-binding protein 1A